MNSVGHQEPTPRPVLIARPPKGLREKPPNEPTSKFERLLLMGTVAILPLQFHIPTIEGFSVGFILFAFSMGYLLLRHPQKLLRASLHPVTLAGFAFCGIAMLMEIGHNSDGYKEIFRIFLMVLGIAAMATLCRDRAALSFGMFGFLLAGFGLACILFLNTYGTLNSVIVEDFEEASVIRADTLAQSGIRNDLNMMAFDLALGAVVGLALSLTAQSASLRFLFSGLGIVCLIAAFLPMSRSGVAALLLSCAAVMYSKGIMQSRVLIMVGVLCVAVFVVVPDVVFSRFAFSLEGKHSGGHIEGRSKTYSAVINSFPEYALTGVGIKDFYGEWGARHGFVIVKQWGVSGAHNCFAQVEILWGLPGLFGLLALCWNAYRSLPRRCGVDPLGLCLLGISVCALVTSLTIHNVEHKGFSMVLGMIVGSSIWLWPHLVRRSKYQDKRTLHHTPL